MFAAIRKKITLPVFFALVILIVIVVSVHLNKSGAQLYKAGRTSVLTGAPRFGAPTLEERRKLVRGLKRS